MTHALYTASVFFTLNAFFYFYNNNKIKKLESDIKVLSEIIVMLDTRVSCLHVHNNQITQTPSQLPKPSIDITSNYEIIDQKHN